MIGGQRPDLVRPSRYYKTRSSGLSRYRSQIQRTELEFILTYRTFICSTSPENLTTDDPDAAACARVRAVLRRFEPERIEAGQMFNCKVRGSWHSPEPESRVLDNPVL